MSKSLEERLNRHPALKDRVEAMIEVLEAEEGVLDNANDAEERVIAEVRKLGAELMSDWAEHKEAQRHECARKADPALKNQGKKN